MLDNIAMLCIALYNTLIILVGDEPAQKRITGCFEGNCNFPCMNCTYSVKKGVLYDPRADLLRNAVVISKLCVLSEEKGDKAAEKRLLSASVQPWISPLHGIPMGIGNDYFKTPPDLFHVFSAGLLKSAVLWVLTIVHTISVLDSRKFGNSIAELDERLHHFPFTPEMPHIPKTTFRQGLSRIVTSKSGEERANATGSAGGFR